MAFIAFLSFNLSMGCMFGPFGVLIAPIEQRLGVTREISTLAVPIVTFGLSLLAPLIGNLAAKLSLRKMMLTGFALMSVGFAILAEAKTVILFLAAYGLFVGPGLCICGVVAPATLVTRWFQAHRGRALGLATTPLLMAGTPLLTTYMLGQFGLSAAYWLLCSLMLVGLVASFFVRDYPAQMGGGESHAHGGNPDQSGHAGAPALRLIADSRFWRLALAAGLYNAVVVMFSTQLVPYAIGLGIDPTKAALLLTAYLVGTLIGTPLVGWAADKVGGAKIIGLLCLSFALWQGLLLVQPSYTALAILAGLAGLQGSAMISCLGLALSEQLGQANFSRAFGASTLIGLPFAVLSVPIASGIFVHTGSYNAVFLSAAVALAIGSGLALSVRRATAAR